MRSTMSPRTTAGNTPPGHIFFFFGCDIRIKLLHVVAIMCITNRSPNTQNLNGLDFDPKGQIYLWSWLVNRLLIEQNDWDSLGLIYIGYL